MNAVKFRGNGCDPKATPAVARHFFAMDAAIRDALDTYNRRNRASKAARDAAGVWRSFSDLAGLCVAAKAGGRETLIYSQAKPAGRNGEFKD